MSGGRPLPSIPGASSPSLLRVESPPASTHTKSPRPLPRQPTVSNPNIVAFPEGFFQPIQRVDGNPISPRLPTSPPSPNRRLSGPPLPASPVPSSPPGPLSARGSEDDCCFVCKGECDKSSDSVFQVDNRVFHKPCFRCMHRETKKKLNTAYYCKPHYKDQMKVLHLKELLDGEKEYITDLEIAAAYKNGMLEAQMITPHQAKILFPDVTSIEALHSAFASKLDAQWKQAESTNTYITDVPIAELFLVLANHLYVYTDYCAGLPDQQKLRESLETDIKFVEYVPALVSNRIAQGVNRNMSLRSTLMKPMQRLCRYPLIFKDILAQSQEGTSEYNKILQAKDKASEIVAFVNSSITHGDNDKLLSEDLFKPITIQEKSQREVVINKMIATEQRFVKSLQVLLDAFHADMLYEAQHRKIDLTEQEVKDMFLGIDTLLSDHVKILVGMRQQAIAWDYETSMISGVLHRYGTFPIYSTIVPRVFKQLVIMQNCGCKEKPKLAKYICKKQKDERTNGKPLPYFLNKIINRPSSYVKLLNRLEKETKQSHPESGMVDGVVGLITVVNKQCCDWIFTYRSNFKMDYLSTHLRYKDRKEWNLNIRGRVYIDEVLFTTFNAKKKKDSASTSFKHTLYLFNDLVIGVLDTSVLWDIPLSSLLLEVPTGTEHQLILVDSSRPYLKYSILLDLTKKRMDRWIEKLNETINAVTNRMQKESITSVPDALIIGTGEYVSGYVHGASSTSDKKIGVVALVLFDMKRRGLVGNISLAGTDGTKFPAIRKHFETVYKDMDVSFDCYPSEDVSGERNAYVKALDNMKKGDLVFIFTPDDLHFTMTKEAISRGLHVLVTKPIVKTLKDHLELKELATANNVLVAIEVHKRWDPIYADARQRIPSFQDFQYFYSYMSQPKIQLITFKSWAGKSSDISYYLNSHHVDFHCWAMQGRITATGTTGIAKAEPYNCDTEDTITLMVQWVNLKSQNKGTAVYTASWVAPKSDVHSQQRFHYMGSTGEVQIDQAHRGYICADDNNSFSSINPIYMKYTPDSEGYFSGQHGYGYKSLEEFTRSAIRMRNGEISDPQHFNSSLATVWATTTSTAILNAGRMSLDNGGKAVLIEYGDDGQPQALTLETA